MKSIIIKEGVEALVDDEDYEYLSQMKWNLTSKGYVICGFKINGVKIGTMHRLVMNAKKGQIVDHINRIRHNNTKQNLRFVSIEQNRHNSAKSEKTKNKLKGISCRKRGNYVVYEAMCRMFGKYYFLGRYKTEISAAYAYNKKALELSPDYAFLNKFDLSTEELEKKIIDELLLPKKAEKQSKQKGVIWHKTTQNWLVRKKGFKNKLFKEEIDAINYCKKYFSNIDEFLAPRKAEKRKQKGVIWHKQTQKWMARKKGFKSKIFKEEIDAINYYLNLIEP